MELDLQRDVGTPLYLRLTSELRRQVENGALKPGDRLPTFAQLRDRYGIHKNTVERAHLLLEQDGLVVREQGRGTFVAPRRPAATPSTRSSLKGAIGFCGAGPLLSNASTYWSRLLEGVWSALAPDGQTQLSQLLLLNEATPHMEEKTDGLLMNASLASCRTIQVPVNLPSVSILATNVSSSVSSVMADDYYGAREAARYLLTLGHERIAYLCSGTDTVLTPRRLAGYRDALREGGVSFDPAWVRRWTFTPEMNFTGIGRENMTQWLREGWRELGCTAMLAHNDEAAVGVIEALAAAGLKVPEDVSVVGFDGVGAPGSEISNLTTIEVPLREIGRASVELLLQQITFGRVEAEHLTLPVTLRCGESTAVRK